MDANYFNETNLKHWKYEYIYATLNRAVVKRLNGRTDDKTIKKICSDIRYEITVSDWFDCDSIYLEEEDEVVAARKFNPVIPISPMMQQWIDGTL